MPPNDGHGMGTCGSKKVPKGGFTPPPHPTRPGTRIRTCVCIWYVVVVCVLYLYMCWWCCRPCYTHLVHLFSVPESTLPPPPPRAPVYSGLPEVISSVF